MAEIAYSKAAAAGYEQAFALDPAQGERRQLQDRTRSC
jgi:hypothetical protein